LQTRRLPAHERAAIGCWATGRDRSWFAARTPEEQDQALSAGERALVALLTARREAGLPLAYLLGFREFFGQRFFVNPSVLIPRAETEQLLEAALQVVSEVVSEVSSAVASDPAAESRPALQVLDLGTGSGCLAIGLDVAARAKGWPLALTAVDQSFAALQTARNNALWHGAHIQFLQGSWFEALGQSESRFDLVLSNPPYIAAQDPHLSQGDLPYEPASALVGSQPNADGLDDLRVIVGQAPRWLRPGGWLLVEHSHDQQPQVISLMQAAGFAKVVGQADLSGTPRLVKGQL